MVQLPERVRASCREQNIAADVYYLTLVGGQSAWRLLEHATGDLRATGYATAHVPSLLVASS